VAKITDFALNYSADIDFLNVKNFDPPFEAKQKEFDWNGLEIKNKDLAFQKHTIYGNNTVEQLKQYASDNKIDLIAFASKHRNFWQSLVHSSTTEKMALSTTLPIVVIHIDDVEN
jgi:nucleotide-binding universal stress UspA family protein